MAEEVIRQEANKLSQSQRGYGAGVADKTNNHLKQQTLKSCHINIRFHIRSLHVGRDIKSNHIGCIILTGWFNRIWHVRVMFISSMCTIDNIFCTSCG